MCHFPPVVCERSSECSSAVEAASVGRVFLACVCDITSGEIGWVWPRLSNHLRLSLWIFHMWFCACGMYLLSLQVWLHRRGSFLTEEEAVAA